MFVYESIRKCPTELELLKLFSKNGALVSDWKEVRNFLHLFDWMVNLFSVNWEYLLIENYGFIFFPTLIY